MEEKMAGYFDYNTIEEVRDKINEIYKENKSIHVTLVAIRKKISDVNAIIVGVYNNFFCVKSLVNNYLENFTINYIDIITNKIQIKEL
jgi:uncharacterized protein Veg